MPLSQQQIAEMDKITGLPPTPPHKPAAAASNRIAELRSKAVETAPKRQDDLLDNPLTRGIQDIFPGKKLGESLGTIAAAGGRLVQGDTQGASDIMKTQVSVPELIGDTANAGLTAASAGLASPASLLPKVASSAAIGGALGGTKALSKGESLQDIGKDAGIGAAIGGAIPLAGEAVKGLGKLFQGAGDKIQISAIKPSQADIKDGFSLDTMKKYDLGGSLTQSFTKTESVMDDLTAKLDANIEAGKPLNLNKVLEETKEELLGKNKVTSFGSNTSIEKAIDQLSGEIGSVSDETGEVVLKDAQRIKRAAGHMGAWMFGQRDPDSTARERVYNVFYTKIKNAIEQASPEGTREINKEISELIPVMNALIRRLPVAQRNNALGLGEIISLTGATLNPAALGVGLLNIGSKSSAVGNAVSKAGEAIQKGIPAVGNALRATLPNTSP